MRNRIAGVSVWILLGAVALSCGGPAAQERSDVGAGVRSDGFLPFLWDEKKGTIRLEISRFGEELIYQTSLPAGLGSNDVGLDRGKLGGTHLVRFERSGPRVLLVQSNTKYRATSDDPAERRAVRDSFAESVLFGFEIEKETGDTVIVDAGEFFLRDAFGIAKTLRSTEQGEFDLDPTRSAFFLPNTKNFPQNTEVEVTLTFKGKKPGRWVREVTPTGESVTVRQRHSFIALPEPGFVTRPFHPGSGFYSVSFADYATPIDEPLEKRLQCRHRLVRKGNDGAVEEPIVYYLDRGAPEPVRSALLDGARWWAEAFEGAGFRDAYRVELMPEDADPMDVRYNVIQWVHRKTRGWSYGSSVVDPRTGEILKGHVSLGSLRVRQDFLIGEALLAPYAAGEGDPSAQSKEALEMALARIRQLSAHEVGHTLGLVHNFAASMAGRASVMDYPHPLVTLRDDGTIDVGDAYDVGIGEWDKTTIAFGYDDRPDEGGRQAILDDAAARGIAFVSDDDARPTGGAHPDAHLWDNGKDAVAELERVARIRRAMLRRFEEGGSLRPGTPSAKLEEALVPAYLFHRYQVEAAVKVVAGVRYGYGSSRASMPKIVEAPRQWKAFDAVMDTLEPTELVLPEALLRRLTPRPPGYPRHRELFDHQTGPTFDPLAAARAAADPVIALLLDPARAARLVEHHARNLNFPSLEDYLAALLDRTWRRQARMGALEGEIERLVDGIGLARLMALAESAGATPRVRAEARAAIDAIERAAAGEVVRLERADDPLRVRGHFAYAVEQIRRYRLDPTDRPSVPATKTPPGSPIGHAACGHASCGLGSSLGGL